MKLPLRKKSLRSYTGVKNLVKSPWKLKPKREQRKSDKGSEQLITTIVHFNMDNRTTNIMDDKSIASANWDINQEDLITLNLDAIGDNYATEELDDILITSSDVINNDVIVETSSDISTHDLTNAIITSSDVISINTITSSDVISKDNETDVISQIDKALNAISIEPVADDSSTLVNAEVDVNMDCLPIKSNSETVDSTGTEDEHPKAPAPIKRSHRVCSRCKEHMSTIIAIEKEKTKYVNSNKHHYRKVKESQIQITKLEAQLRTKSAECENLSKELKAMKIKCDELEKTGENSRIHKMDMSAILDSTRTSTPKVQEPVHSEDVESDDCNVLVIGDSNTRRICKYAPKNITYYEGYYSALELLSALKKDRAELEPLLDQYTKIFVYFGVNDATKRLHKPNYICANLASVVKILRSMGKDVTVGIPFRTNFTEAKSKHLNSRMESFIIKLEDSRHSSEWPCDYFNLNQITLKHSPSSFIEKDGYHIRPDMAKYIAGKLAQFYSKSLLNLSIKRSRDDDVEKPVDKRNKLDGDEIIMKELSISNTMMKNLSEQDTSFLKNTAATHTTQILKNRDCLEISGKRQNVEICFNFLLKHLSAHNSKPAAATTSSSKKMTNEEKAKTPCRFLQHKDGCKNRGCKFFHPVDSKRKVAKSKPHSASVNTLSISSLQESSKNLKMKQLEIDQQINNLAAANNVAGPSTSKPYFNTYAHLELLNKRKFQLDNNLPVDQQVLCWDPNCSCKIGNTA